MTEDSFSCSMSLIEVDNYWCVWEILITSDPLFSNIKILSPSSAIVSKSVTSGMACCSTSAEAVKTSHVSQELRSPFLYADAHNIFVTLMSVASVFCTWKQKKDIYWYTKQYRVSVFFYLSGLGKFPSLKLWKNNGIHFCVFWW